MNDVKVISTDIALRQAAASPQAVPSVGETEGQLRTAEEPQLKQEQSADSSEVVKSKESVSDAVASLNEYAQTVQRDLQFKLDDSSGKTVITVLDRETDTVVRQIPDDVALRLAQDLQQDEPISLFNAKV
jgi:flagellar protein FlaG